MPCLKTFSGTPSPTEWKAGSYLLAPTVPTCISPSLLLISGLFSFPASCLSVILLVQMDFSFLYCSLYRLWHFPSSCLLSQHLLSLWYMSHTLPIGENTQLSKMEWHSHLTHLVMFTSMRLLPLLLNRKLPEDWNYVLTRFCTALDALHWWPHSICWTKFEFVSLKKNYSNVFPSSRYTVKFFSEAMTTHSVSQFLHL